MFGLEALDVLIGLVTVYLVFALACTAIVEAFAAWFKVRSKNLSAALGEFLAGDIKQGETFVNAFYSHPLVQSLSKGKKGQPSYIAPEIVGQVVEGLVTAGGVAKSLADAVNSLPGTPETNRIKGLLDAFAKQASGDFAMFRKSVETHFDAVMERVTGWIKRYSQTTAIIVSAALVIGANVDTVGIASSLAINASAREKMLEIAGQRLTEATAIEAQVEAGKIEEGITLEQAKEKSKEARAALDRARSDVESAGLQFGWKDCPKTFSEVVKKIAGLIVSILAISLGAPFWFDVLQRFMQVRSTGVVSGKKKDEKK
jgi:hypothetical protein